MLLPEVLLLLLLVLVALVLPLPVAFVVVVVVMVALLYLAMSASLTGQFIPSAGAMHGIWSVPPEVLLASVVVAWSTLLPFWSISIVWSILLEPSLALT